MFGVYVHWPFCASKCPYCDFNSHVRESIDHAAWLRSYVREIEHYASLTPGRAVTSVFFGGGTPSLMEPETVAAVIGAIQRSWPKTAQDIEITLEANPGSVERDKFAAFRAAGINRVSLGVQSLRDEDLQFLGRKHNVKEALEALETASKIFDRYSFDLIYARPEQEIDSWRAELEEALEYANGHLSLYQLTIEQGTPFYGQHARGEFAIPDNDRAGAFYEVTQDIMAQAGLPAYEISNHAAEESQSQHNLTYWRYGDYAGIGPGAHGRLTLEGKKWATRGHRAPEIWLERVAEQGHGSHPFEAVSGGQRFTEAFMMGMRLREGVSLSRLAEESGQPWDARLDRTRIQALAEEGLLVLEGDCLRPTIAGMQRLNGILSYLL